MFAGDEDAFIKHDQAPTESDMWSWGLNVRECKVFLKRIADNPDEPNATWWRMLASLSPHPAVDLPDHRKFRLSGPGAA
jgi:hypothetical protein